MAGRDFNNETSARVCRCGVPGFAARSSGLSCERFDQPAHGVLCPHGVTTGGCYACDHTPRVSPGATLRGPTSDLFTDDQLRAECERRGMYTDDHLDARIASLKSKLDHATQYGSDMKAARIAADADRDEWRRRAEFAEGQVKALRAEISPNDAMTDWVNRANAAKTPAERLSVVNEGLQARYISQRQARKLLDFKPHDEMGLGLMGKPDPRPDNSIAHLPEDLLCEDA